jgi:tetratricopeptide (TPR) repeat protein
MKKLVYILLLLLSGFFTKAQPGGGGGLKIYSIFDSSFNKLSIRNSTVKVRAFVLYGALYDERTSISHEIELQKSDTLYLDAETNLRIHYTHSTSINLRLYFIYKSDTSIVDYYNVRGENALGDCDRYDSLVLKQGYTSYSRIYNKDSMIINHKPNISISFLDEEILPQTFYHVKGVNAFNKNDLKATIDYLLVSIDSKKKKGRYEANLLPEAYDLLAQAYYNLKAYNKAEEYSSKAIKAETRNYWYYKTHIKSLIKLNKLNEASDIYNLAVKCLNYSDGNVEAWLREDRAFFNINYLHNYDTVISEYQKLITTNENLKFYPNHSIYSAMPDNANNYFILGVAKFGKGNFREAYNDWLKAFELNYGDVNHGSSLVDFDSILRLRPRDTMIYLLRAIALYKNTNYAGGYERAAPFLNTALNDILIAEKLGLSAAKIHLWKARILLELRKYKEALEQVNLAILLTGNDYELYNFRSGIWREIGSEDWEKNCAADWKKSDSLSYKRRFEELNITSFSKSDFRKIEFKIYDPKTNRVFPNEAHINYLKNQNSSVLKGKGIENIELNGIMLQSHENKPDKINPEVHLYNDTTYGMVFSFPYRQVSSKTIKIRYGNEEMTLVFSNILNLGDVFIDSIPFENGLKTIDIQNIGVEKDLIFKTLKKEERSPYYKPSGLNVKVLKNYNEDTLISVEKFYGWATTYLHLKKENNDTTYIYYGNNDKRFLFCKGIYKTHKYKCPKVPSWQVPFDDYRKYCYRDNQFGTWYYYDINGNLLSEKQYTIRSDHFSHPYGTWKYYEKRKLILEQNNFSKGKYELIYY